MTWFSILIKVLTSKPVDFIFSRVGGVETDIYPASANINTFGFKPDGVEVDGAHLTACSQVDNVEPIVAGAVAVGEVGVAVLYLAPLRHTDTSDGDGLQHVVVGETDTVCADGWQVELLEVHGPSPFATKGIEIAAIGIDTPILRDRETITVIEDALDEDRTVGQQTCDVACLVAIAARDIEQWEGVAVGIATIGEGGIVAMRGVAVKGVRGYTTVLS